MYVCFRFLKSRHEKRHEDSHKSLDLLNCCFCVSSFCYFCLFDNNISGTRERVSAEVALFPAFFMPTLATPSLVSKSFYEILLSLLHYRVPSKLIPTTTSRAPFLWKRSTGLWVFSRLVLQQLQQEKEKERGDPHRWRHYAVPLLLNNNITWRKKEDKNGKKTEVACPLAVLEDQEMVVMVGRMIAE